MTFFLQDSFDFILFGVHSHSWFCIYISFANLGSFHPLVFLIFLLHLFCFLSGIPMAQMLDFCCKLTDTWSFSQWFAVYFLYLVQLLLFLSSYLHIIDNFSSLNVFCLTYFSLTRSYSYKESDSLEPFFICGHWCSGLLIFLVASLRLISQQEIGNSLPFPFFGPKFPSQCAFFSP